MRLLSQRVMPSKKYPDKLYSKFWIIIPNSTIPKLGWEVGLQLSHELIFLSGTCLLIRPFISGTCPLPAIGTISCDAE